jgi:NAD(P)-dependent dehydrogenase (short-subunit alcohol dehydrogenase family)
VLNNDGFRGQSIIVTAAGSGIGRAIAEAFLAAGAKVHICDVDPSALAGTLAANDGMRGTLTDVGNSSSVEVLFREALAWMETLDVLVNNAGIGGPRGALDEIPCEEWDRTIQVNLSGAFYCVRQAAAVMKKRRSGCILNISTTSARTGLPLRAPYVASKVGLLGLTRNIARELGPYNIRCNAILPGAINNERGRRLMEVSAKERGITVEQAEADRMRYISMRTRVDPSEVAAVALFLASPGGRHVTGQEIGVCGNSEWEP